MTRFLSSVYLPYAGARWTPQNRLHTATVHVKGEVEYDRAKVTVAINVDVNEPEDAP